MVFKYLMAGMPVPQDLIDAIKSSPSTLSPSPGRDGPCVGEKRAGES